jgi:hypothetical protein
VPVRSFATTNPVPKCDRVLPSVFRDGSRVRPGELGPIPAKAIRMQVDYGQAFPVRPFGVVILDSVSLGSTQGIASVVPKPSKGESIAKKLWGSPRIVRRLCGRFSVETASGPVEMPVFLEGGTLVLSDRSGKTYLSQKQPIIPFRRSCLVGSIYTVNGVSVFVVDRQNIDWCRFTPEGIEIAAPGSAADWPITGQTKYVPLEEARQLVFAPFKILIGEEKPKWSSTILIGAKEKEVLFE